MKHPGFLEACPWFPEMSDLRSTAVQDEAEQLLQDKSSQSEFLTAERVSPSYMFFYKNTSTGYPSANIGFGKKM